jgi:hypothetical protein
MLLKHALGTVGTAGAGPYTHTFTPAVALPTGLTIGTSWDNNNAYEVFEGCKINQLRLTCEVGRPMLVEVDVIAETAGDETGGTTTYATLLEASPTLVLHHQAGNLTFDGENYKPKSFTLTIDNRLARINHLGSKLTQEPARSGHLVVQVDIVREKRDPAEALKAAYRGLTRSDMVLTFTSGSKSITVTLDNAVITACSEEKSRFGPIEERATFRGICSPGDSEYGLEVVVVNANSAAV